MRKSAAVRKTSNGVSKPNLSSFIWSVADLLRGDYKQSEYGRVILPFTVLRRLDCVLEETKEAVLGRTRCAYDDEHAGIELGGRAEGIERYSLKSCGTVGKPAGRYLVKVACRD